jgi:hypothetical protein
MSAPVQHEMRKHALRRYLVFRVKVIEFLDIVALWHDLTQGRPWPHVPASRKPRDFADSLRTVLLSWFALFIDKSKDGMDVIELWKQLFPSRRTQIEGAWCRMKPAWDILRTFRDRAGFHADKPVAFFKARREILMQQKTVMAALREFQRLLGSLLRAEATELPDFRGAVDEFLDELESDLRSRFNRGEFTRYLMLHSGSGPLA